jgi:twitching motility protein PilI
MANREALRELQARLASRLQTARSEGVVASWLAVQARGKNYLFPLAQSGEIFPVANLQPVPYVLPWFRGVLNIRGGLYGVVDLARFISPDDGHGADGAGEDFTVVTLNNAMDVNCALQVDSLLGLRGTDAFASCNPAADDAPAYFGNYFLDADGNSWQEINLRTLAQTPQFLSIRA